VVARWFNTAGPCVPTKHFMIPASDRLPEVPDLVEHEDYFVVHAPRQTGKTTTLAALAAELTNSGRYAALITSCEPGRALGDDIGAATRAILDLVRDRAEDNLPAELRPPQWPDASAGGLFGRALRAWSEACPRPVVLFIDEIDALEGRTLVSVLSQLRAGASGRPGSFPVSIALCGLRDLRDYKTAAGGNSRLGGPSPFNIIVDSLRLGDFSVEEVRRLYSQHTADTGQKFSGDAVERAFELTQGQPWLVNALASEVVRRMAVPTPVTVTASHMETARERLIQARATHLDSLVDKLSLPRVRAIIQPILAGTRPAEDPLDDDLQYVRDLGLIAQDPPVRIANPIYAEVIVRVLTDRVLQFTPDAPRPRAYLRADGGLDFSRLLREFLLFWKANGDILVSRQVYHEVAPQLVMMAFLQRVINGGGRVTREYGVGRGRLDLLVHWPLPDPASERVDQQEAMELKVRADGDPDPLDEGLVQLDEYLDRLTLDTGALILFDRRSNAPRIVDRSFITTAVSPAGRIITLFRG
jgi:ATPase family associated with various cellular activities (AAA)